jgi:hypothetical protein
LLSQIQLHYISIRIIDNLKVMVPRPHQYHHSLSIIHNGVSEAELVISLHLNGITSYIPLWKPFDEELESSAEVLHIKLTAEFQIQNPNANWFPIQ